jgi:hypothetical protein
MFKEQINSDETFSSDLAQQLTNYVWTNFPSARSLAELPSTDIIFSKKLLKQT